MSDDATPPDDERDGSWRGSWWVHPGRIRDLGKDPDYRFSLANERTFLAWIRTSLAMLAGGVAVVQLVPAFSFPAGRHLLGVPLVLMSIVVSLVSYRRWAQTERAMRLDRPLPPSTLPRLLGIGVALISVVALVFVVFGSTGS